jgi:hypothetical protein
MFCRLKKAHRQTGHTRHWEQKKEKNITYLQYFAKSFHIFWRHMTLVDVRTNAIFWQKVSLNISVSKTPFSLSSLVLPWDELKQEHFVFLYIFTLYVKKSIFCRIEFAI